MVEANSKQNPQPVARPRLITGAEEADHDSGPCSAATMQTVRRVYHRPIKLGTAISIAAFCVTILGAGFTAARIWGQNEGRLGAVERRAQTQHSVIESVRNNLNQLSRDQAATKTAVDEIKRRQGEDRAHFDRRLNQVLGAIRRAMPNR